MTSENNTVFELIHFTFGFENYYYTTTNDEVIFESQMYAPAIMEIGSVLISDDFYKTNLDINIRSKNVFVNQWIEGTPDYPVHVTVLRYDPLTDTASVYYSGLVTDVTINQSESKVKCNQESLKLSKQMATNFYQKPCRHILYSKHGCRLNRAPYVIIGPIEYISGNVIRVTGVTSTDPDYYLAGEVVVGSERKTISDYNTTTKDITLMKNLINAQVGDETNVYGGCDHTPETCLNDKNNILNFGGHSFIPEKNPLTKLI